MQAIVNGLDILIIKYSFILIYIFILVYPYIFYSYISLRFIFYSCTSFLYLPIGDRQRPGHEPPEPVRVYHRPAVHLLPEPVQPDLPPEPVHQHPNLRAQLLELRYLPPELGQSDPGQLQLGLARPGPDGLRAEHERRHRPKTDVVR